MQHQLPRLPIIGYQIVAKDKLTGEEETGTAIIETKEDAERMAEIMDRMYPHMTHTVHPVYA